MARRPQAPKTPKSVEALTHEEAKRKNIPTAEYQSVMRKDDQAPVKVSYPRGSTGLEEEKEVRNRDLDPQLIWRGKDQQDWSDLVVHAPPLYIQEKVHPKVLIDDLRRQSEKTSPPPKRERVIKSTSLPISMACPTTAPKPSSTSTTLTDPIA